jgi:hypothetical protein
VWWSATGSIPAISIMKTLILLLILILPVRNDTVLKDHVDLIEYNHYHDSNMKPIFDQLIFYDWSEQKRRFQVRAWRLVKLESQIPFRDHYNKKWMVRWHDNDMLREVTSPSCRETWTQYDPEVLERDFLPQDQRLGLKVVGVVVAQ